MAFTLFMRHKSQQSLGWQPVYGTIISSKVEYDHGAEHYTASIRYQYSASGVTFEGRQITFGGLSTHFRSLEELVQKYPANSSALIYYNPQNPKEAVLIPGEDTSAFLFLIVVSLLFIGFGLFGWMFWC